jgi:hypothetical protein
MGYLRGTAQKALEPLLQRAVSIGDALDVVHRNAFLRSLKRLAMERRRDGA